MCFIFFVARATKTYRREKFLNILALYYTAEIYSKTKDIRGLNETRDNLDGDYILNSSLDNETAGYNDLVDTNNGWDPIGNNTELFKGSFNGHNHTINDLYINRDNIVGLGLFSSINGTVKDLNIDNINVAGGENTSHTGGLTGKNEGLIENVDVSGDVEGWGDTLPDHGVGLLAGSNHGTIDNCSSSGSSVSNDKMVGGLVGLSSGGGLIKNSHSNAYVGGGYKVGGLVGESRGEIIKSYATGLTQGVQQVGGLVGESKGDGSIENSYAEGDVESIQPHLNPKKIGGLVGENWRVINNSYATGDVNAEDAEEVGGLVGQSCAEDEDLIKNSYATGDVTGNKTVGGFVGKNDGVIKYSYSEGKVSGNERVGGFTGRLASGHNIENSYSTGKATRNSGSTGESIGGFVGYNYRGIIIDSFSTGSVEYEDDTNPTDKGFAGAVSINDEYEMKGNYWNINTSEQTNTSGNATGKNTEDMTWKYNETYEEWDFGETWLDGHHSTVEDQKGNTGYPTLQWQNIKISNWHDLNNVQNHLDLEYTLVDDLDKNTDGYGEHAASDANDGYGWKPIGDRDNHFIGTFDGQNYNINDFHIDDKGERDAIGLFSTIEGEVENVGIENATVKKNISEDTWDLVGGLVGQIMEGEVRNSFVKDSYIYTNAEDDAFIDTGAFLGHMTRGYVYDSYTAAEVEGDGESRIGGFAGVLSGGGDFIDVYTATKVKGGSRSGGFAAQEHYDKDTEFVNTYWNTNVSSQEEGVKARYDIGKGEYVDVEYEGLYERTTEDMTWEYSNDTYEDWDFNDTWMDGDHATVGDEEKNIGYPGLEWQEQIDAKELIINTDGEGSTTPPEGTHKYRENRTVNITSTPDIGWKLQNWTDDVNTIEDPRSPETTIKMEDDYNITANFTEAPYFQINITSPIEGEEYREGDEVKIDYRVENIGNLEGTQNITLKIGEEIEDKENNITLQPNQTHKSNFTWEANRGTYELNASSEDHTDIVEIIVESTGTGGYVRPTPTTYDLMINAEGKGEASPGIKTYTYIEESEVEVEAYPAEGWYFEEWTGDHTGTEPSFTINMTEDRNVTAHFKEKTYYHNLTINIEGNGTTEPQEGVHIYEEGENITITAEPEDEWKFHGWTDDHTSTEKEIKITITEDKNITAHFKEKEPIKEPEEYDLTINIEGEGETEPQKGTHTYEEGKEIKIIPEPKEGWKFQKWTGDHESTEKEIKITIDNNKEIKAHFIEKDPTIKTRNLTIIIVAAVLAAIVVLSVLLLITKGGKGFPINKGK